MKKEYVKPENRVVVLQGRLMEDDWVSQGGDTPIFDSRNQFDDSEDSYSDDVWED